jgi:hypothetical protein
MRSGGVTFLHRFGGLFSHEYHNVSTVYAIKRRYHVRSSTASPSPGARNRFVSSPC